MKRLAMLLACASAMIGYSAEYVITVSSGTQDLKAAMDAAYPDATLAEGDTIVKRGAGMLTDSEDALALTSSLTFVVEAGELEESLARTGCTFTVSSGASVVVKQDLRYFGSYAKPATFNLSGAGTEAHPGALSVEVTASMNNQFIDYNLTDDTTIYTTSTSSSGTTFSGGMETGHGISHNRFTMNGHTLTFKGISSSSIFRLRLNAWFVNPGPIVLNGVGFTRTGAYAIYCEGTPKKIPLVKLINGARLNCVNSSLADKIEEVDCEYGTTICKVYDDPSDYTLAKITGCPSISADQIITVGALSVRLPELTLGHRLSAAGTLAFPEGGAVISIDEFWSLPQGVACEIIAANALSGGTKLFADSNDVALTLSSTNVTATFTGEASTYADSFIVNIPYGKTYDWATVTNGIDAADIAGRTMMKIGGGTFSPGTSENVAASGLTNLIVSCGVYGLTAANQLPVDGEGAQRVEVHNGATLKISAGLNYIASADSPLFLTAAGNGFAAEGGAVVLASGSSANAQYATYSLVDDATFYFSTAFSQFNFSARNGSSSGVGNTDKTYNVFNLNGHTLTFKGPEGVSGCVVRFRYAVSFNDSGAVVFDNVSATHLSGARVYVDGVEKSKALPVFLRNGASINCVDAYFAEALSCVDGEEDTRIVASGNYTFKAIAGCPSITGSGTITVSDELAVRADDLLAGRHLAAESALVFGNGSVLTLEGVIDPASIPEGGYVAAKATGGISGKPSSAAVKPLGLRALSGKSDAVDALLVGKALGLLLSIH